ncbi:MAG: hypothetical protein LBH64_00575 [Coriobacteriales bacterium]|nr:hypothetical protein [Coriobacteriales bacterium]
MTYRHSRQAVAYQGAVTVDWENTLGTDARRFFLRLFARTGISRSTVIRKANINRTYGYQIMNGTRCGKRDYYIAIAIAMHLDLDTTQWMLAVCGAGVLYPPLRRDAAIITAIENRMDFYALHNLLRANGLPPLDTGIK